MNGQISPSFSLISAGVQGYCSGFCSKKKSKLVKNKGGTRLGLKKTEQKWPPLLSFSMAIRITYGYPPATALSYGHFCEKTTNFHELYV